MDFRAYLAEQLKHHPSMQIQDVIKLCYQAAHGPEHLLADPTAALRFLEQEFSAVTPENGPLYEQISPDFCRFSLSAWKAEALPLRWLFRIFAASCQAEQHANERLLQYLLAAEEIIFSANTGFTKAEWDACFHQYKERGMPAVHHSETYRACERPAYRLVHSRFCRLLPVLQSAKEYFPGSKICVIAIDGRAASGKTTLAALLQTVLDGDVLHMDDFFLPPELRTEERFQTPGGNIHHERFSMEVLPFLRKPEPFSYRVFDCGSMTYRGTRDIGANPFRIVEGSYSCHPAFGSYGDITVFSDVSTQVQLRRIRTRNGEEMLQRFKNRWIPMEEAYFSSYSVRDNAHIVV